MKKHLMIVFAVLLIAGGCDKAQKEEEAARNAHQDAKVAAAVAKQKRGELSKPIEGDDASAVQSAAKIVKADDDANDGKTDPVEKTETSTMPVAKTVLSDAIASAKAEDKALFVHFTADW